jgi:hypothetical protein
MSVQAVTEIHPAELDDLQTPPRRSVVGRDPVQRDDTVREALELKVVAGRGAIVEQECRARADAGLEVQELAPVSQRIPGEQAEFGDGVKDQSLRPGPLERGPHAVGHGGELGFRRMEDRPGALSRQRLLGRRELEDLDPLGRPAVRADHALELGARLRERDVHRPLAVRHSFQEKLERERGLADARIALDKVQPARGQAPAQKVIEARHARRDGLMFHDVITPRLGRKGIGASRV